MKVLRISIVCMLAFTMAFLCMPSPAIANESPKLDDLKIIPNKGSIENFDFDPNTIYYNNVTASFDVEKVSIEPTANNGDITVIGATVVSGDSKEIELNDHTKTFGVTIDDSTDFTTYTIIITKDQKIDDLVITDISQPVAGEVPDTTPIDTDQYTGTIAWDPDHDLFEYATAYTATIALTPKEGWVLEGIEEDFFTVEGASHVSYNPDSGEVTAEFEQTEPVPPPEIATDSSIGYGDVNPAVTVTGENFCQDLDQSKFRVEKGATGLSLSGLQRESAEAVVLQFTGTASEGTVSIQAKDHAFDPIGSDDSNTLNIAVPDGKVSSNPSAPAASNPSGSNPSEPSGGTSRQGSYGTGYMDLVTFCYHRFLQRAPDPQGKAAWQKALDEGIIHCSELPLGFVSSEECQARIAGYSNEAFIQFLYRAMFAREPDPEGYAGWQGALANAMSREDVVRGFSASQEFQAICSSFGMHP